MPEVTRGSQDGSGLRVAVICARFNEAVTKRLFEGALRALSVSQVDPENIRCLSVAGAVEIPVVARKIALAGAEDAIVALGAVIRGETSHYDLVCRMAADGCQRVALDTGIPVSFGVLTCDNGNQALLRAGEDETNKGYEAALVAVETANLLKQAGSS